MKVAIVCAFDTYFDRVKLLKKYYQGRGLDVIVITSNFSHRKKEYYVNSEADIIVKVKSYQKNLSFSRLFSHYEFSIKSEKEIEKVKPDYIHALIPCNSLVRELVKYKKRNSVKLIFDIIDLWPETIPVSFFKQVPPFKIWKNMRDKYLDEGDIVFTECNLFQEILHKVYDPKYVTLYWSKMEKPIKSKYKKTDGFKFCYLGSINNIIDIKLIIKFLAICNKQKKTTLHIIGNGEAKKLFVSQAISVGVQVIDHKEVYSQQEKQLIFDQCDYGFNVMKQNVVVGLTMKSLDYMCGGLPILNTIQGDTKQICNNQNIGFNINYDNLEHIVSLLHNEQEYQLLEKRNTIKKLYLSTFTSEVFFSVLDEALMKGKI